MLTKAMLILHYPLITAGGKFYLAHEMKIPFHYEMVFCFMMAFNIDKLFSII
jgi:hypothetical protein